MKCFFECGPCHVGASRVHFSVEPGTKVMKHFGALINNGAPCIFVEKHFNDRHEASSDMAERHLKERH